MLPIKCLTEDINIDKMQESLSKFKEKFRHCPDSDNEIVQPTPKEPVQSQKGKVGRPKGSTNKEKFKAPAVSLPNEDEHKLIDKYNKIRITLDKPRGSVKRRRFIKIFGVNSSGEKSLSFTPDLEERCMRAEEVLEELEDL